MLFPTYSLSITRCKAQIRETTTALAGQRVRMIGFGGLICHLRMATGPQVFRAKRHWKVSSAHFALSAMSPLAMSSLNPALRK